MGTPGVHGQEGGSDVTTDELRERIADALRGRHGADVHVAALAINDAWRAMAIIGHHDNGEYSRTAVYPDEAAALAALAIAVGLDADGTDPRAELEAERKRSAAEEWQRRGLCAEGNRLGEQLGWANSRAVHAELEAERLTRELAEARALLNGGRTPTDAQIAAHEGKWLVGAVKFRSYEVVGAELAIETANYERKIHGGYVWHAIDEASGAIVPPPKGQ